MAGTCVMVEQGWNRKGDGQERILDPGGEGERGRGSIRCRASPQGSADFQCFDKDKKQYTTGGYPRRAVLGAAGPWKHQKRIP